MTGTPVLYYLDEQEGAKTLVITYGITAGAAREAVATLRTQGVRVSILVAQTLLPVPAVYYEILDRYPVDVVLCDLGMPGMTGWDVGLAIRTLCRNRGIQRPAFVMLTGWGDQVRETERMEACGVDRILAKPVDIPQLLEVILELSQDRSTE